MTKTLMHLYWCTFKVVCFPSQSCRLFQQLRPTPPHLTSAAAESLLAQACENESQNAKRMRMGLEPLPVSCGQCTVSNALIG